MGAMCAFFLARPMAAPGQRGSRDRRHEAGSDRHPGRCHLRSVRRHQHPVVYGFGENRIITGLISNLARTRPNLTGVTFMAAEPNTKPLELLREAVPNVRGAMLLVDAVHPGYELEVLTSEQTAQALGIKLEWIPTRSVAEVRHTLAALDTASPDALVFLLGSVMLESRKQVVEFALRHKILTLLGWTEFAHAGGLLSYGSNLTGSVQRVGYLTSPIARAPSFRTCRLSALGISSWSSTSRRQRASSSPCRLHFSPARTE
jgi:hypothetical protein